MQEGEFDKELQRASLMLPSKVSGDTRYSMTVSVEDVQVLQLIFQQFMSADTVAKATTSLEKWKRLNEARLHAGGFAQLMNRYRRSRRTRPTWTLQSFFAWRKLLTSPPMPICRIKCCVALVGSSTSFGKQVSFLEFHVAQFPGLDRCSPEIVTV